MNHPLLGLGGALGVGGSLHNTSQQEYIARQHQHQQLMNQLSAQQAQHDPYAAQRHAQEVEAVRQGELKAEAIRTAVKKRKQKLLLLMKGTTK